MTGLAEQLAAAGFPVTVLYTGDLASGGVGPWFCAKEDDLDTVVLLGS